MGRNSLDAAKIAAAKAAVAFVQDGMIVGLGTGSTASFFIGSLIQRCSEGLKIQAVATSERSLQQAVAGGIPIANLNDLTAIDLDVDGADEIDAQKRMIKGGGGALLREKIIASMSHEMIAIVDESKVVTHLGAFPLPVEIIPFGYKGTIHKIESLGYAGKLRMQEKTNNLYITDSGNFIFDINFPTLLESPEHEDEKLRSLPGVVETGFFFHLAGKVLIGHMDGTVEQR